MPCARRTQRKLLVALTIALSAFLCLRLAAPGASAASLSRPGRQAGELERIQLHRNSLRGAHYLPAWRAGSGVQPDRFTLKPTRNIDLDGDPQLNARGGVYPIRSKAGGGFDLLHFNGYRIMRVYSPGGAKLWQVDNPSGRAHRDVSHRDTLAVFDADGDGGQDIVHCWRDPGASAKSLVLRDGATGRVLKKVQLAGQSPTAACQIAAFRVEGRAEPLVLVAGQAPDLACARGNFTEYFAKTYAFRADLSMAWERTTCAAGHYAWPLDEDGDGRAEAVFVGKYLLRPDGTTRCVLPLGGDHVDSMVVADLDPYLGGHEALTVGTSGTRFFDAGNCAQRWAIGTGTIANPQQTGAAYLRDTAGGAPNLLVTNKLNPSEDSYELRPLRGSQVSVTGQVVGTYVDESKIIAAPSQNANLDGAPQAEDRVTSFGQVVDRQGRRRLDTSWYWGLQRLTAEEQALDPREQWSRNPFAFDLDDDGRDELVVWGRRKLVAGTLAD
jgi:hypothetical protein